MGQQHDTPETREAPWIWLGLFVGLMGGLAWRRAQLRPPAAPLYLLAAERDGGHTDLARASPRTLRRLPGLGVVRSADLVRARWQHGEDPTPLALDEVRGIGEGTVGKICAALGRDPDHDLWIAGDQVSGSQEKRFAAPFEGDRGALLP